MSLPTTRSIANSLKRSNEQLIKAKQLVIEINKNIEGKYQIQKVEHSNIIETPIYIDRYSTEIKSSIKDHIVSFHCYNQIKQFLQNEGNFNLNISKLKF